MKIYYGLGYFITDTQDPIIGILVVSSRNSLSSLSNGLLLITFVDELRNDFGSIENEVKILSLSVDKEWSNGGKNKLKII